MKTDRVLYILTCGNILVSGIVHEIWPSQLCTFSKKVSSISEHDPMVELDETPEFHVMHDVSDEQRTILCEDSTAVRHVN